MIKNIVFSNFDDLKNPWYGGGGARAIHEVAKRLAKTNTVTVITGSYPGSKNEVVDNVSYVRIGVSSFGPFIGQAVYQLLLPWHAMTRTYDVWVESFTPPLSTAFLPVLTRKPVVGVTHTLSGRDMQKKYHLPFQFMESLGLKFYKQVITLTNFQKQQVLSANKNINVHIVPNGVPSEIIDRKAERPEKHILFLGRIDVVQKGLDILLSAYATIANAVNLPLVIVGSGPVEEEQKLKKLIQELGLAEKVRLAGRVDGEEKFKLFEQAACTVMPSRTEGFPLVALEAMACGSPLVISNIEGLKWLPDSCAVRVKEITAESFAGALEELLKNADKRTSMSQAGKVEAAKYSWDTIAKEYSQILTELVKA